MRSSAPAVIQFLDLDRFKIVNDTCGHKAGDALIKDLSDQLTQVLGDKGEFARLGGDEFAVLYQKQPEEAAYLSGIKLLNTVSEYRFIWDNQIFNLGVSIGMVSSHEFDVAQRPEPKA